MGTIEGGGADAELTNEYLLAEANQALTRLREWRRGEGQLAMGSDLSVNTKYLRDTVLAKHPHREAVMRKVRQLVVWNDHAE